MDTKDVAAPSWSTSSFGGSADTSAMELSALGAHLDSCKRSHGRLFALHGVAQALNGFVAARLVTTLVVVTALIGLGLMVF